METVSVIIPAYNAAPYIEAAITSVLNQTTQPIEIIIIDDGSVDNTVARVRRFFPSNKITLLQQQNSGPSVARNFGASRALGSILAFLDADDAWDAHKLELQLPLFANPKVGVVFCNGKFSQPITNHNEFFKLNQPHRGQVTNYLLKQIFIPLSSTLTRKHIFQKVGGFNSNLHYAEDYDLWLRTSICCEFDYIDKPLITYRVHSTQASSNILKLAKGTRIARTNFLRHHRNYYTAYSQKNLFRDYIRIVTLQIRSMVHCLLVHLWP